PYIQTTTLTGDLNFEYITGTGTTSLTFRYTLTANDFDFDGLTNVSAITLNGGTIADTNTVNASTSFTAQDLTSIFIAFPDTMIWSNSNFVNLAPAGGTTISSSGVPTTEACGSGTCRTFDGDD